jgi:hypothetical protein
VAAPALALDSTFGALHGEAQAFVARRYADGGLSFARECVERRCDTQVACTAREGGRPVGMLSVRLDGRSGLNADLLFARELAAWRDAGVRLSEFGALAVDSHAQDPRLVLARLFHLGYLHAHRRWGSERLVIEVHPRHVAFYRRWLGLLPCATPRHNPRVNAPAALMSIDFSTVRDQIGRWAGKPHLLGRARCLYPLAWDAATEAEMLERLR